MKTAAKNDNPSVKILIVDDDENMRVTLSDLMETLGLSAQTAKTGTEALKILHQRPEDFDIVLTDLIMPDYNGLDILKEVKKRSEDILVAIVTGYASLETAVEAIRAGAYDYITKPFTLGEVEILIRNALERIRLRKENIRLGRELQELHQRVNNSQESNQEARRIQREIKDEMQVLASKLDKIYELLQPRVVRRS